jgi:GNAT superfamily N-acetyltransferase
MPLTFSDEPHAERLRRARSLMNNSFELIAATLPVDFSELEADATLDGHRHLTRLAAEFTSDRAMFHAIYACRVDGQLAGIGAITDEPAMTVHPAWRMRRLYVHRRFRRRAIARTITSALILEAEDKVSFLTVHAGNDGAAKFWEAMGFRPVRHQAWSHEARVIAKRGCGLMRHYE